MYQYSRGLLEATRWEIGLKDISAEVWNVEGLITFQTRTQANTEIREINKNI